MGIAFCTGFDLRALGLGSFPGYALPGWHPCAARGLEACPTSWAASQRSGEMRRACPSAPPISLLLCRKRDSFGIFNKRLSNMRVRRYQRQTTFRRKGMADLEFSDAPKLRRMAAQLPCAAKRSSAIKNIHRQIKAMHIKQKIDPMIPQICPPCVTPRPFGSIRPSRILRRSVLPMDHAKNPRGSPRGRQRKTSERTSDRMPSVSMAPPRCGSRLVWYLGGGGAAGEMRAAGCAVATPGSCPVSAAAVKTSWQVGQRTCRPISSSGIFTGDRQAGQLMTCGIGRFSFSACAEKSCSP